MISASKQRKLEMIVNSIKSRYPQFPLLCCTVASSEIAEKTGMFKVRGIYVGPLNDNYETRVYPVESITVNFTRGFVHHMNYDKESGLFVDTTMKQFKSDLPDVVYLESSSPKIVYNPSDVTESTWFIAFDAYAYEKGSEVEVRLPKTKSPVLLERRDSLIN